MKSVHEKFDEEKFSAIKPAVKTYPRNSFDRFGDDLVEFILSFLSFSDKVLLERVCKQWQRVIYRQQTHLIINRSENEGQNTLNKLLQPIVITDYATGHAHYAGFKAINKKAFESVLKKCSSIKRIEFECFCDGDDLQLIGKHCTRLESLECDVIGLNERVLIKFGQMYGHRLKTISLNNSFYCSEFIKKFLRHCPHVENIYTDDHRAFIDAEESFLPKLKVIKSVYFCSEHMQQFNVLADRYYNQLQTIRLFTHDLTGHQIKSTVQQFSRFKHLQELEIYLSLFQDDNEIIDDDIMQLAKSCSNLKILDFTLNNNEMISNKTFPAFGNFFSVEKFRINLQVFDDTKVIDASAKHLKTCTNLRELKITYIHLTEDFFTDIHLHLPQLQEIEIYTEKELSDRTIHALAKLRSLRVLKLSHDQSAYKLITDASVCDLIQSNSSITKISFGARPKITDKSILALISAALKKPKIKIEFHCGFSSSGDEATFQQIDMNQFSNLPQNLSINILLGPVNPYGD